VVVSVVTSPSAWTDWFEGLRGSTDASLGMAILPLPVRLALAGIVVAWGGMTGRYWTVAVAAILAHPAMSTLGWLIALGAVRHSHLLRRGRVTEQPAAT